MNVFELSRNWFNFCFDNPEKIRPIHSAIYFFAIEHCNRLGWKDKFGFPSQMVMEAIGVKNWRTYSKALIEVVEWGFIEMIETSKNQYSSNIIALVKNTKAHTKALDKALSKHSQKHSTKHSQSTVSIDIQETNNKEQYNKEQENIYFEDKKLDAQFVFWLNWRLEQGIPVNELLIEQFKNDLRKCSAATGLTPVEIMTEVLQKGWKTIKQSYFTKNEENGKGSNQKIITGTKKKIDYGNKETYKTSFD